MDSFGVMVPSVFWVFLFLCRNHALTFVHEGLHVVTLVIRVTSACVTIVFRCGCGQDRRVTWVLILVVGLVQSQVSKHPHKYITASRGNPLPDRCILCFGLVVVDSQTRTETG